VVDWLKGEDGLDGGRGDYRVSVQELKRAHAVMGKRCLRDVKEMVKGGSGRSGPDEVEVRLAAACGEHVGRGGAKAAARSAALADRYALEHAVFHLCEAGMGEEARELLLSFDWLLARTRVGPAKAVLADGVMVKRAAVEGDWAVELVESMLRSAQGALVKGGWTHLAGQLVGRLMGYGWKDDRGAEEGGDSEVGEIGDLVRAARGWKGEWVKPQNGGEGAWRRKGWWCPVSRTMEPAGGTCLGVWTEHTGRVRSVAMSGDGKRSVSGGDDKTVIVWDVETGECLRVMEGHTDEVRSVAISGDGKRVVSGGSDKTVRVWDVERAECLKVMEGHTDGVRSVTWSWDGKRVVSGSDDKTVRVWDVETGECLKVMKGHTGGKVMKDYSESGVRSVAVSRDGRRVVSGGSDKTVRVWDVETGECLKVMEGHTDGVGSVAVSRDGKRVVSGGLENSDARDKTDNLRVWDVETGKCLKVMEGHTQPCHSVAWLGDGKTVVSAGGDNEVCVWDVETRECLKQMDAGHTEGVFSVAVSGDGKTVVSGGGDKTVRVWDVARVGEDYSYLTVEGDGHAKDVCSVAVSGDGKRVVSGSKDFTVVVWDVEAGKFLKRCSQPLTQIKNPKLRMGSVRSVAMSGDGRRVVSGDKKTVRVWDGETEESLKVMQGHTKQVTSVAISGDGKRVVSGGSDKTVRMWDVETGECLKVMEGHTSVVRSVALSGDGKRVVSGSTDTTMRVWDVETRECLKVMEGHTSTVTSVAVSRDGKKAVSVGGGSDKTVRVWDVETGKCLFHGKSLDNYDDVEVKDEFNRNGFVMEAMGFSGFHIKPGHDKWWKIGPRMVGKGTANGGGVLHVLIFLEMRGGGAGARTR
jgi:WD40 repeat protein